MMFPLSEGFGSSIMAFLLKSLIYVSAWLMSIFTIPIMSLAALFIPDLSGLLQSFTNHLTTYVIPGLAFAREVFFNITGYPRSLFHALILIYFR